MNGDESRKRAEELVTPRTRWLAIVTGFISGLAGSLPFGPLFLLVPAILIFGAVLQRWSPRPGRWLIWLGAFFLTLDVGAFLGPAVLRPPHSIDSNTLIILSLGIVSIALVSWCDLTLIVGAIRMRNAPSSASAKVLRTADWIVAVFAVCLTAGTVWWTLASFYYARRYGRWDISWLSIPFVLAVAVFDAALTAYALEIYRARGRQNEPNK